MRCERWIAFFFAGLFLVVSQGPAKAVEYPYCMTFADGWAGSVERCEYSTMQQCQASTGGLNGSCAPNWRLQLGNNNAGIIDSPKSSRTRR